MVYLFLSGPPVTRTELHVRLDPDHPEVPSLAHLSFPAGRFERLHGGLGVMADDAMAAVYANVSLRILLWLLPAWVA